MPSGVFNWFGAFNQIPDSYVLNHQSLDGYLLLRFLKIATVICLVGCLVTWPVLFPVNATGGGGQKQLNILSFSNVAGSKYKYLAHTFIAWIFCGEYIKH
jgi:calcium permeable stress-gated cation channel